MPEQSTGRRQLRRAGGGGYPGYGRPAAAGRFESQETGLPVEIGLRRPASLAVLRHRSPDARPSFRPERGSRCRTIAVAGDRLGRARSSWMPRSGEAAPAAQG